MSSSYDFCLGCMSPKGTAPECLKCGYIEGTPQELPALRAGVVLADRYVVGKVLSQNGEGFTYIGMDMRKERKVIVREFLPFTLCTRTAASDAVVVSEDCGNIYYDYLNDFIDIARAVSRLSDMPSIVPVIDLFECNNTAYAIYTYVQGKPLSELVRRAKRLSWDETKRIFTPLISSLVSAQALGLVHFGISPDTIIMDLDGRLRLTGFGVPDARLAETDLRAEMFDGYSALEQYSLDGERGKWTDVYAVCASMLYALTGKRPPDALARTYESRLNLPSSLAGEIPSYVVSALANGLQVNYDRRTQTMEQLRSELLSGHSETRSQSKPQQQTQQRPMAYAVERPVSKAPAKSTTKSGSNNTAWYKNLSQFQYGVLAAALSILVLGTICVIIFFSVRDKLHRDDTYVATETHTVASVTDVEDNTEEMCVVPNFLGKSWADVMYNGEYVMFDLMEKGSEYSDTYPAGTIMAQSTPPGTEVRSGTPIAITISLGSEMCTVPNVIGKTVAEADQMFTEAGLVMGSQREEYNDSVEAGRVIGFEGTSPGARMKRDSGVNIIVSLGRDG